MTKHMAESRGSTVQTAHLLKIFPEAKSLVQKYLSEIDDRLELLKYEERDVNNTLDPFSPTFSFKKAGIDVRRASLLKRRRHYARMIEWQKKKDGAFDIEKAKDVPISEFIEFNRGNKTQCIWHNERTPSLHYYKHDNRVKCFGCGRYADVIDVVRQLNGHTFRQAVRFLTGGS